MEGVDLTIRIHRWPTAISGINCRIGLNITYAIKRSLCAHNAPGDRVFAQVKKLSEEDAASDASR